MVKPGQDMATGGQTLQLEMLVQIAQSLSSLDLDEVLHQTVKLTTEVVGATKGSFLLLDEHGRALQRFLAAREEMDPETKRRVSYKVMEDGLAGWVIANRQSAIVDDTAQDRRWIRLDDELRVRAALCVPFFVEGNVRGVLTLEHPEPYHFNQQDLRLVEAAANQASAALRNAQLFDRVQSQQRLLEAVLDSITDAVLVADHEWQILMLNPAAEVLLQASGEAAIGKRLSTFRDNPLFVDLFQAIALTDRSVKTQTFELRDEASRRDYLVSVAALHQQDAQTEGYVIALADVTSLKDLSRLKTHMIRMASHDLKNPLSVLLGYLDIVRADFRKGVMPDPGYVENMYRVIARMEDLISTLLDTQRLDHETKRQPISPQELIEAVLDDVHPEAIKRGHKFATTVAPNLREIRGDAFQLREAIGNLIYNAIKYTPDGGTIRLDFYVEDDRFYFTVEDHGIGIPADQQSQIFQPYFRTSQPQVQATAGTGVGLSLVKEVVERHGGQIWFSSKEGIGSIFTFWLPLLE